MDKFYFILFLYWYLAHLVGFIILETPRQGVKTACSELPKSIRYFNFYSDSLSEETSVVETMRALSQPPANYTIHSMSQQGKQQLQLCPK